MIVKTQAIQSNIPNGWSHMKLGQCLAVKHGKSQKEIEVQNGKYPILASGGVIGHTNTALYSKPSVLIGRKGTIDKPQYMDTPFWTVDTLFYTQLNEGFLPKYIYYIFKTINWELFNEGSSLPSLSATTISTIKVTIPPFTEQNRIVGVLETWDQAIEKLNQKIELKKNINRGLMQVLLQGKTRFSGYTAIWKSVELGRVATFVNGFTFKSSTYVNKGKYKIITIANVQDGNMVIDDPKTIAELPADVSEEQILKSGDLLISMTGNVGRVCIVNQENCLLNQRVGKVIATHIQKDLLYQLLHDRNFLYRMMERAQGGAQDNLSTKDIKKYVIRIPIQKEEQETIANVLTASNNEITSLKKKIALLKDQQKYLLNNLVTGTIRAPEKLELQPN